MAIWSTDLTTEDGALGAAQMGGVACLVSAALTMLGAIMSTGLLATWDQFGAAPYLIMFALIQAGIYLAAAARLRAGKGVLWGSAAAVLLVLELLLKLVAVSVIGIILNVILLIFTINGIRGAQALHKGIVNGDEAAEIFR